MAADIGEDLIDKMLKPHLQWEELVDLCNPYGGRATALQLDKCNATDTYFFAILMTCLSYQL